jgi:hypothetical protein
MEGSSSRLKIAELTSSMGAGILGGAIALFLSEFLKSYTIPIFSIGLFMHVWGMYDKHKIESGLSSTRVWWVETLYYVCWAVLIGLVIYIIVISL